MAAPEEPRREDRQGWGGMPSWVPRAIILALVITLLATVAVWFLWKTRSVLRWLLIAQFFAFALEPAVNYLHEKRGWRRGAATGAILGSFALIAVLFAVLLVPQLVKQVQQLAKDLPSIIDNVNSWTEKHFHTTAISSSGTHTSSETVSQISYWVKNYGDNVLGAVGSVLSAIFALFTIGLFTFYLTANGPKVRRALLSVFRPDQQRSLLWAINLAIEKTGGYFYSRMLLALINGGIIFIVLQILGVPFAVPLAMFQGVVAEFIPIVGTYIASAVPAFFALLTVGPWAAFWVIVEALIYQQVENYYLSPHISQKTMELNAGIAFAAACMGGAVGGLIGAFFALPVAAIAQAFLSEYGRHYEVATDDPDDSAARRPPNGDGEG